MWAKPQAAAWTVDERQDGFMLFILTLLSEYCSGKWDSSLGNIFPSFQLEVVQFWWFSSDVNKAFSPRELLLTVYFLFFLFFFFIYWVFSSFFFPFSVNSVWLCGNISSFWTAKTRPQPTMQHWKSHKSPFFPIMMITLNVSRSCWPWLHE